MNSIDKDLKFFTNEYAQALVFLFNKGNNYELDCSEVGKVILGSNNKVLHVVELLRDKGFITLNDNKISVTNSGKNIVSKIS